MGVLEAAEDLGALARREGRVVFRALRATLLAGGRQHVFGIEAESDDEIGRVDPAAYAIADGGALSRDPFAEVLDHDHAAARERHLHVVAHFGAVDVSERAGQPELIAGCHGERQPFSVGRDRHIDDVHVRIGQLAHCRRRRLAQLRHVDHSTLGPRGLSARRHPFLVSLNHGHAAVLEGDLEVAVLRLDLGHIGRVEVQLQAVAGGDQLNRGSQRGFRDLDLIAGLSQLGFGRLVRG